jgi:YVTN family beta-propeller protein
MAGIVEITLPDLGGGLVVAGETLWVATDSGAVRVDPSTGAVSEVIQAVTNLAFDGQRLWAGGENLLLELDPQTGEILRRLSPDYGVIYVAATPDAIWASDTGKSVVRRIDPSDGHVVATIEVPSTPKGTTLGEGALWVACDGAATVVRIDVSTNEIAAQIAVGRGPHTIAAGEGSVWVTNRKDSTLSKIDAATNRVVATVVDVATSPAVGVAAGPSSVFVSYRGGVALVDPELATVTDRIAIRGANLYDLKLAGNTLWASDFSHPRLIGIDLDAWSQ